MNCLAFERLLDQGELSRLPEAALPHARDCARCARSLARARSLEHALARCFAGYDAGGEELTAEVPAGFADRVMLRVERGEARGVRWLTLPDELPWWVRAAAEPSVALAATVAALLLWRGDLLLASARAWLPLAASAPARLAEIANATGLASFGVALARALVPAPGTHWSVAAGMALGMAPLLALAGYGLWRMGERLAGPAGVPTWR